MADDALQPPMLAAPEPVAAVAVSDAIGKVPVPVDERAPVYARAAAAVAPGGRLLIVGHDRLHGSEGQGGPDTDRLFTATEIAAALQASDPTLIVERAEVVRRVPAPGQGPIDALLVLRRP